MGHEPRSRLALPLPIVMISRQTICMLYNCIHFLFVIARLNIDLLFAGTMVEEFLQPILLQRQQPPSYLEVMYTDCVDAVVQLCDFVRPYGEMRYEAWLRLQWAVPLVQRCMGFFPRDRIDKLYNLDKWVVTFSDVLARMLEAANSFCEFKSCRVKNYEKGTEEDRLRACRVKKYKKRMEGVTPSRLDIGKVCSWLDYWPHHNFIEKGLGWHEDGRIKGLKKFDVARIAREIRARNLSNVMSCVELEMPPYSITAIVKHDHLGVSYIREDGFYKTRMRSGFIPGTYSHVASFLTELKAFGAVVPQETIV